MDCLLCDVDSVPSLLAEVLFGLRLREANVTLGSVNSLLYHLTLVFFNLLMSPDEGEEVELIAGEVIDEDEDAVVTSGASVVEET